MSSIAVPQVEYVGGNTPQETAALFNARMIELRFNKPSFERDGIGFWITYSKDVQDTEKSRITESKDEHPRCEGCPLFESVGDRVKWGRCKKYGGASVSRNKLVCTTYWREIGGDELNA